MQGRGLADFIIYHAGATTDLIRSAMFFETMSGNRAYRLLQRENRELRLITIE
jgi:hypothetical protein